MENAIGTLSKVIDLGSPLMGMAAPPPPPKPPASPTPRRFPVWSAPTDLAAALAGSSGGSDDESLSRP